MTGLREIEARQAAREAEPVARWEADRPMRERAEAAYRAGQCPAPG